jgi:flavin reductase (DIM6/NTAB) family NADH-FMN oxidoreductase RutF
MKNNFKNILPSELGNAIEMIGKEWMIILADDESKPSGASGMTASWGCLGVLWNKPVCVCFIRPQRYTYGLANATDKLSFNFFGNEKEYREALGYFGKKSGRDTDKIADMGLSVQRNVENGVPFIAESKTVLIGKKLYEGMIEKSGFLDSELLKNYPTDDFHKIYVCEIEEAMVKN